LHLFVKLFRSAMFRAPDSCSFAIQEFRRPEFRVSVTRLPSAASFLTLSASAADGKDGKESSSSSRAAVGGSFLAQVNAAYYSGERCYSIAVG
jgi:hypothetical protein